MHHISYGPLDDKANVILIKVEEGGHAFLAGVQEGDEVVSLNGEPCADLTLLRALAIIDTSIDCLQLLVKRYCSSPTGDIESEETYCCEKDPSAEALESTSLHIFSPKHRSQSPRELYISKSQDDAYYVELDSDTQFPKGPQLLCTQLHAPSSGNRRGPEPAFQAKDNEAPRCFSPGDMVELQVSFSEQTLDNICCTSLGSAHGIEGEHSNKEATETVHTATASHFVPYSVRQPLSQHGVVLSSPSMLGQVEVILQQPAASRAGRGIQSVGGPRVSGSVGSQSEEEEVGGHCEGAPGSFSVSFGIPSEEETPADEQGSESEGDQDKPNKHRAKHARLRRSESLSEKQVKEAKSKCKRIALLLTAAPPNPNNKGVLMFKKHRQRAKKYTLVSYGTGEDEPEYSDDEDEENQDDSQGTHSVEFTLVAPNNSELDKQFPTNAHSSKGVLTINWDKGLLEIERSLNNQAEMECLPDTKGKGALMFAQRRQRMDEISAEHDELRRQGIPVEGIQEAEKMKMENMYMQPTTDDHAYMDHYSANSNGTVQHQTNEMSSLSNRTAKPFSVQNMAVTSYSPAIRGTNQDSMSQGEQIASRDERISTPAIKTSFLLDARRRNAGKPMFTFKEAPKVSPNPELLNLLNRSDKKMGFDLGPEEDYLSLGAEACNFLQSQSVKHKTPPPVAPKPMINPNSPPWSPQIEVTNQDMPQHAENSVSTPAVAPTVGTTPAPEAEPTPAPEPSPPSALQEAPASTTTEEQHTWTLPEPESQQEEVTAQEENGHTNSTTQPESAPVNSWAPTQTQAQQQTSTVSWHAAQVQPQQPHPSQSPPQPPRVTCQPTQTQVQPQTPTNTWTPQIQTSWNQSQEQEQAQAQTHAQPCWAQPHEQSQSQVQVQPPWTHLQEQPHLQKMQPSWGQPQEPMEQQPQASWAQPSQADTQHQPQWMQQPQQKSQVQPPWVQQVQPESQPQPPWVRPSQHQAPQQAWPQVHAPGQAQPPWVSAQPQPQPQPQPQQQPQQQQQQQQQPSINAWPSSQTQVQPQPPWIQAAQPQPPIHTASLNPWAPVPAHVQSQPSWAQHPPEHGQDPMNTWGPEQNQTQPHSPWAQSVPPQPTPQPNWQQPISKTPPQSSMNTWPPAQTQPQTPVNAWAPQSQQTPVDITTSMVNTRPSPKPWQPPQNAPQNRNPPLPPQRMNSFTIGQRASPPINPMATVLNPSSSSPAFEMPAVRGKGADMFAKRQSRMEKFVVDSETVQANKALGRSYSLSPPARVSSTGQQSALASSTLKPLTRSSTTPPTRQICSLKKGHKPLTPWEAASRHPLGLVDEAFAFQNFQQTLASNVRLAAQRKILPEPPAEWKATVFHSAPQKTGSQTWSQSISRSQSRAPLPSFVSPTKSVVSTPAGHAGYRSLPRKWQPHRPVKEANPGPSAFSYEYKRPMGNQTYKSVYTSNTIWSWKR
ncbi:hypothetical protein PAMP_015660 [Pampus punctatissimus]